MFGFRKKDKNKDKDKQQEEKPLNAGDITVTSSLESIPSLSDAPAPKESDSKQNLRSSADKPGELTGDNTTTEEEETPVRQAQPVNVISRVYTLTEMATPTQVTVDFQDQKNTASKTQYSIEASVDGVLFFALAQHHEELTVIQPKEEEQTIHLYTSLNKDHSLSSSIDITTVTGSPVRSPPHNQTTVTEIMPMPKTVDEELVIQELDDRTTSLNSDGFKSAISVTPADDLSLSVHDREILAVKHQTHLSIPINPFILGELYPDLFAIVGLAHDASETEIEDAFENLEQIDLAEDIQLMYSKISEVLKNPKERKLYSKTGFLGLLQQDIVKNRTTSKTKKWAMYGLCATGVAVGVGITFISGGLALAALAPLAAGGGVAAAGGTTAMLVAGGHAAIGFAGLAIGGAITGGSTSAAVKRWSDPTLSWLAFGSSFGLGAVMGGTTGVFLGGADLIIGVGVIGFFGIPGAYAVRSAAGATGFGGAKVLANVATGKKATDGLGKAVVAGGAVGVVGQAGAQLASSNVVAEHVTDGVAPHVKGVTGVTGQALNKVSDVLPDVIGPKVGQLGNALSNVGQKQIAAGISKGASWGAEHIVEDQVDPFEKTGSTVVSTLEATAEHTT
eukprot:TRINITY_DN55767_c0_g1_i1.p1 TRINITY_DN55767_c0_g1~~TRINITY_DN55767_c0_g1_i1.p1  ORF type:complete len:676 (+),score=106.49 TRINITY_DN55767_c0_g1_i1:174-2030(+)